MLRIATIATSAAILGALAVVPSAANSSGESDYAPCWAVVEQGSDAEQYATMACSLLHERDEMRDEMRAVQTQAASEKRAASRRERALRQRVDVLRFKLQKRRGVRNFG